MKKLVYDYGSKKLEFTYSPESVNIEMMKKFFINPGWYGIVHELIGDLFDAGWDGRAEQVKEKFGGLRFYISQYSKPLHELIYKAEELSLKTCDICGQPGKMNVNFWIQTRCDDHILDRVTNE